MDTVMQAALEGPSGIEWGEALPRSSALLLRAKAGDRAAFGALVLEHQTMVLRTAVKLLGQREDGQDAAQEVFLKMYRNLARLDESRPLEPWLYRVTVNTCHSLSRKRATRKTGRLDSDEAQAVAAKGGPSDTAERDEDWALVRAGLASLPSKERSALVLRDLEGLSTKEVAKILQSSQTTVRSQVSRARVKMRKFREKKMRHGI